MSELLIRQARLVRMVPGQPDYPVDVRVCDGLVAQIGPGLVQEPGQRTIEAEGRWLAPGFWDHHVHFSLWAVASLRFDTSTTRTPEDLCAVVATQVAASREADELLVGFGHRPSSWERTVTTAELDAVSGCHPVVLIAADVHSGWVNSAAQRLLQTQQDGICYEHEWFELVNRLERLQADPRLMEPAVEQRLSEAARLGVVGLVDLVFDGSLGGWPELSDAGAAVPRVQVGIGPAGLDLVEQAGYRTGDRLDRRGQVTMGPLKLICDGALTSVTACCRQPYGPDHGHGVLSYSPDQLLDLVRRGHAAGLEIACHAIGDAAAAAVLDVFEQTGARGSIEHAQLMTPADIARTARLGLVASVQPYHLIDDIEALDRLWPDRAEHAFALRSLLDAGVELRLGSDAPIAPLDPLAAMAAAVHRNLAGEPSWHPEQRITVAEALAASVRSRVRVGAPADLVLLDADPLAVVDDSAQAAQALQRLRPVYATICNGRVLHCA